MSIRWMEVAVEVDREWAEIVAEVLYRYAEDGVIIEQGNFDVDPWEDAVPLAQHLTVRAYLPDSGQNERYQQDINRALQTLKAQPIPAYRVIDDNDWWEAWKASRYAMRIGQRIFICPPWYTKPANPGEVVIRLDSGVAFGSGTHPTTQTILEAMEHLADRWPGATVLDLGCGSGVLGIAAAKMGAVQVVAVDIDPAAIVVTNKNAADNGVDQQVIAQEGSLHTVADRIAHFDAMLVNIITAVVVRLCEQNLGSLLKPGGVGFFSGIMPPEVERVEAALRLTGLEPHQRYFSGRWAVIEAYRPSSS